MNEEQQNVAHEFKAELVSLLKKYDAEIELVSDGRYYPSYDIEVRFNWQYDSEGSATRKGFEFKTGNFLP